LNKKIVHITSAHPRNDIRIFTKMCLSLARASYDVTLIVADGKGDEVNNGVKISDVGKVDGRFARMFYSAKNVYLKALSLNADIYHLHDPELLPYALKLKNKGKTVVFDSHEDVPVQILSKPYFNKFLLKLISVIFECFENFVCKKLDCIVGATPFITNKFLKINSNSLNINNYPILGELESDSEILSTEKSIKNTICYVGGISVIRGAYELAEAIRYVKNNVKLCFAGSISEDLSRKILHNTDSANKINLVGVLSRSEVKELLNTSFAGLVTLLPTLAYKDSLPIKMFEYMSAGLPVIASNFPLWKEIIEGNDCGICVDPLSPKEIAETIDWLYENQDKAKEMGKNGQKAVYEKYNWQNEEKKLLGLYKIITGL